MITREQLLSVIGGVLTTINEVSPTSPIPASSIYLAIGSDLEQYRIITDVMVKAGLVIKTTSTIALTELGRAKAIELENAIAK